MIVFYLFIAQHYVIGRTWRAIQDEKSASEPHETPSGAAIPTERTDAGGLRDAGVLSAADAATIQGRFETAVQGSDPDGEELLEALRTLHEEGILTEAEYEENRREITATTRQTDLETGSTTTGADAARGESGAVSERATRGRSETAEERTVASTDRTASEGNARIEADPDPTVEPAGDADDAESAPDRLERFAMLRQLYGLDVLTDREYEAERRELGSDDREGIPEDIEEDLADRLRTVRDLYEWGLLTREEYAQKRRDLLEDSE